MQTFLTAYDPLDLPGTSIDPLGFERGYLLLADKILPGMTNVASRPRYFSVLCAGSLLTPPVEHLSPQQRKVRRQDCVKRLERLWVLANLLAAKSNPLLGEDALHGIRGVRYVRPVADKLVANGATHANAKFQMLVRQAPYGVIGIYGAVAEGLRLLGDRKDLSLTPDLGEELAEGFLKQTGMPPDLRKAVSAEHDTVPVSTDSLRTWGEKARVAGEPTATERRIFREITFSQAAPRARMAALALNVPWLTNKADTELARLARMERWLQRPQASREDGDLLEVIRVILAYEHIYRLVLLAFERVLWKCKHSAALADSQLETDPVLRSVRRDLPRAADQLDHWITQAQTPAFHSNLERLDDAVQFVARAAAAKSLTDFLDTVLVRHRDVQHGKFDRGRRKLPWIERRGGRLCLALSQVGRHTEVTTADQIVPHLYRLGTLDSFLRYARSNG